jgi:hypothetical protein
VCLHDCDQYQSDSLCLVSQESFTWSMFSFERSVRSDLLSMEVIPSYTLSSLIGLVHTWKRLTFTSLTASRAIRSWKGTVNCLLILGRVSSLRAVQTYPSPPSPNRHLNAIEAVPRSFPAGSVSHVPVLSAHPKPMGRCLRLRCIRIVSIADTN